MHSNKPPARLVEQAAQSRDPPSELSVVSVACAIEPVQPRRGFLGTKSFAPGSQAHAISSPAVRKFFKIVTQDSSAQSMSTPAHKEDCDVSLPGRVSALVSGK
ncbi:hypothetical protein H4582DRAFT_2072162 [Lactarius indigo]|nr:hypothetical protein H4582DRAFT_2072162 [Lactarius indigo]